MGRFYNGDIEGKFWVAVQSSDDASYFGGQLLEPSTIEFEFTRDDNETIEEGIKNCKEKLGENLEKLDDFFKDCEGYNDIMIAKALKVGKPEVKHLLEWYARLEIGNKIKNHLKDNEYCIFECEL